VSGERVISLRSTLAEIPRLAAAIEAFCEDHHLAPELASRITLAVEEAVVNIIVHGYGGAADQLCEVRLARDDDAVRITVSDEAPPFDPLTQPPPDTTAPLERRQDGGLGIYFVRTLMDDVRYRREGSRNILVLTKRVAR
jgi:serine/threonine-protein kinase RsbW/sigma-B regulation protein RsbU (phosphoserine phosphatase)